VKRPLWTLGRRWEDNIKMDLKEVGYEGLDWIKQLINGCSGWPLWTLYWIFGFL